MFRLYRLHARIKETFKHYHFSGDSHIGDILFVLLVMLLLGAERLQHIDYLRSDPLFCRVVRLTRVPHWTKISTALKQFTSDSSKALIEANAELVIEKPRSLGRIDITLDLNGTVVSTKGHPTWEKEHDVFIFWKKVQKTGKHFRADLGWVSQGTQKLLSKT